MRRVIVALFLSFAFLSACSRGHVVGVIVEKTHRDAYSEQKRGCGFIGKLIICDREVVSYPETWGFLVKVCEDKNECDYVKWPVSNVVYNCYSISDSFDSEITSCP